jgi:hypothetical protein
MNWNGISTLSRRIHAWDSQRDEKSGSNEMSENKPMLKIHSLSSCFRMEGDTTLFSVAEFIRVSKLRDGPQLREVVIEEMREMFPDVRIVEEEN